MVKKSPQINGTPLEISLKLMAKTSFIVLAGVFLSKLFTYVHRIIVARYFGPEVYGLFYLALMITGLFTAFFSFGLESGILRYISIFRGEKDENKIRFTFKRVMNLLLFSGIFSAALLYLFAETISLKIFHNSGLIIFLQIFSIVIPISILYRLFLSIIQSFEKIRWYSFIDNIIQSFLKLVILILLIYLGFGVNSIIFSYVLGMVGVLLVSIWVGKCYLPTIWKKYQLSEEDKKRITKSVVSYSWPLMLFALVSSLFYWIDSLVIGYFENATKVGFYNAAVPIASLLVIVTVIFNQLFFPLITKEYARKKFRLISDLSKQVSKWIFLVNLPLLLIVVFFPGALLNILFGQEYLLAENALRFLAISAFFSGFSMLFINLISMIGKSKLILINIVITSLINLVSNIILVPIYGINGAAFSTMLCSILLTLVFLFQIKSYLNIIPLKRKMIKIVMVMILPLFLLFYTRSVMTKNLFSIITQGVIFLIFYFILIFLTGCLDENDWLIIKAVKNKLIGE